MKINEIITNYYKLYRSQKEPTCIHVVIDSATVDITYVGHEIIFRRVV